MATNKLYIHIFRDLEAGTLSLPALPEMAAKIRRTLNDPDVTIEKAANLIRMEPNLSAYILKIANSVMYQRVAQANDINTAIVRLGYLTTRNISTTYAMRSLFKPRTRKLRPIMKKLWMDAAELAATSAVLATKVSKFPFDEALTAGLVQDIGILPMLEKLNQLDPDFDFESDLHETTDKYAAKVGALVLHKWNFHEDLVEVVRSREDWHRDPQPEAQLADVVLVARLLIHIRHRRRQEFPAIHTLPAFKKLLLAELGPEESIEVLKQAQVEIDQVRRMLV